MRSYKRGNFSKEQLADKKISMAIMSSTVILTIQYFILITFNLMNTTNESIIQLISKALVGILFLYALPTILKQDKKPFVIVYYFAILLFLLHYLYFPENQEHMKELIFPFFFTCLPMFIYSLSIKDLTVLKLIMKKASFIVFVVGLSLSIQIFFFNASIGTYSMTLSYYMLLPTLFFLDELLDQFSIKSLVFSLTSLMIILAIGSRGALLCIAVFILLKLIRSRIVTNITKTKILFLSVFVAGSALFIVNLKNILLLTNDLFLQFNIHSRNILLLLSNELDLSGRENIYQTMLAEIVNNPLAGIGIAGDRRVMSGVYAHNFFLEVLANYGVLVGSLLIIALMVSMIRVLIRSSLYDYNMMILWISLGFISLFVSGSYLTDLSFWSFLGLFVNLLRRQNVKDGAKVTIYDFLKLKRIGKRD